MFCSIYIILHIFHQPDSNLKPFISYVLPLSLFFYLHFVYSIKWFGNLMKYKLGILIQKLINHFGIIPEETKTNFKESPT